MFSLGFKKKITYILIAVYFLLGGIEYAVILPTVWLFLDSTFHSKPFMLGLVLSAFSFSGLLAAPIMGRWADVSRNTKLVVLVANLFEIGGSFMYFMGLSDWFLVLSRLVAGIGTSAMPVLLADITRVTSVEARTGAIATCMACRQIGMLAGPGCNLFLRELDFYIGPFQVNKYTSPGLFMALLWALIEVLTILFFWNLPTLQRLEREKELLNSIQYTGSENSSIINEDDDPYTQQSPAEDSHENATETYDHVNVNEADAGNSLVPRWVSRLLQTSFAQNPQGQISSSSDNIIQAENLIDSIEQPDFESDTYDSNEYHDTNGANCDTANRNTIVGENCLEPNTIQQDNSAQKETNTANCDGANGCNGYTHNSGYDSRDELLYIADDDYTDTKVLTQKARNKASVIKEDTEPTIPITLQFLYNEYIREEVVVLLYTVFAGFFNQLVIETICTPLTQKLLNWGEMENSILYCIAAVQVLIMFAIIRVISKRVSDRNIVLFGVIVLVFTDIFYIWFIPQAKPGHANENFWGLCLGTFLYLVGVPAMVVSGASLFSKVTRPETQGLSQGLRRVAGGLAMILGPIWASGTIHNFYIMLGVCLALNVIIMVMYFVSYRHLKGDATPTVERHLSNEPTA